MLRWCGQPMSRPRRASEALAENTRENRRESVSSSRETRTQPREPKKSESSNRDTWHENRHLSVDQSARKTPRAVLMIGCRGGWAYKIPLPERRHTQNKHTAKKYLYTTTLYKNTAFIIFLKSRAKFFEKLNMTLIGMGTHISGYFFA